jgi:hypothetical protein
MLAANVVLAKHKRLKLLKYSTCLLIHADLGRDFLPFNLIAVNTCKTEFFSTTNSVKG